MIRKSVARLRLAAIIVLLVSGGLLAFLNAGRFLETSTRAPERADLIVALGGDSGARVKRAGALYKQGLAQKILLTGMEEGNATTRSHYLNWRAQFLIEQGVPPSAIIFDEVSRNSWDEANNTLRLMQAQKMNRVLVVSDPPHLRRLNWSWGKVFAGSDKSYQLVPSDMEGWDAVHWWRNEASEQFVVTEYVKLSYYLIAH